jgi:hypothetical protein
MACALNGIKSYFTQSAFGLVKNLKSNFGEMVNDDEIETSIALSNLFIAILIIVGIVIGFIAVPHLCPDNSERGKNVRLGLYFLLIITGGQLGWFMALLWLFKINICL